MSAQAPIATAVWRSRGGVSHPAGEGEQAELPVRYYTPGPSVIRRDVLAYAAADGRRLDYLRYLPAGAANGIAITYLHGIESHAGWFEGPAYRLAALGYTVYSLDRRGSGMNRERRGCTPGDAGSFEQLLEDVQCFQQRLDGRHAHRVLAGLSWGGKLATACALRDPESQDALVLITPGLAPRVDLTPARKAALLGAILTSPLARFAIPIEPEMFTSDPRWLALIGRDPLRLHTATARFFWESHRLDRWIAARIKGNRVPILLFLAGRDRIIDNEAVIALLGRGRQPWFAIRRYEDQSHSIQFEAPDRLVRDMHQWLTMEYGMEQRLREKEHGHDIADRKNDCLDYKRGGEAL